MARGSSAQGSRLPEPGVIDQFNALAKLCEQLAAIDELNQELPDTPPYRALNGYPGGSLPERVKKYIQDLTDSLMKIVSAIPEVESLQYLQSFPMGGQCYCHVYRASEGPQGHVAPPCNVTIALMTTGHPTLGAL